MQNKDVRLFLQAVANGEFTSQQIGAWTTLTPMLMVAKAKGYAIARDKWYEGVLELQSMTDPSTVPSGTPEIPKWLSSEEKQLNMAALEGLRSIPKHLVTSASK